MKKLLCLALALMLALTMTCAIAEELVAEEGAKIEFCYWESSDTIHDTWEKIIADFRALHPEIELIATTYPSGGFVTQMDTRFAAQDYPDVMMSTYNNNGKYKQAGLMLDISNYISAEEKAAFIPGYLSAFADGEKLLGLPLHTDTICMYYNKRMFEEQGVRIPTSIEDAYTVEELNEIGKKMKEAYGLDFAFGGAWTKTRAERSLPFLYMCGGHVFAEDDYTKLDIDTDEFRAYMNLYKNWLDEGLVLNVPFTTGGTPCNEMFQAEQLAYTFSGSWQADTLQAGLPDGWGITYLPTVNGNMTSDLGGNGLFGLNTTKYPNACAILLQYLTSREVMTEFCEGGCFIPVRADIDRNALVYTKYNDEMHVVVDFVSSLSSKLVAEQTSPYASMFAKILSHEMDAMIVDGDDIDTVIERIYERWEEEIDF